MNNVTTGNNKEKSCCAPTCCNERESTQNLEASLKDQIQSAYGRIAEAPATEGAAKVAKSLGYSDDELTAHGEGNLGLGCGNPVSGDILQEGHRVLDLGSGAGFDALIARSEVGETGYVIGVDMTRSMLKKARRNAAKENVDENVEFREGTIENLPVASDSVDVVISNCVVNLSQDKPRVFQETHRVLRSGGRLVFSDILLSSPLPEALTRSVRAVVGCVGNAGLVKDYKQGLEGAGFVDVRIEQKAGGACLDGLYTDPLSVELRDSLTEAEFSEAVGRVGSYRIQGRKP